MSKTKSQFINITFTKGGEKPDSAKIKRFDGTELFIQYKDAFAIYHDFAHYAIESALMVKAGFFWMINSGLEPSDFILPKEKRPDLLIKALENPNHIAIEFIANQLLSELNDGGSYNNFIALLDEGMAQNGAAKYTFRFDDVILEDIRDLYHLILEGWKMFPEHKERNVMIYYPSEKERQEDQE